MANQLIIDELQTPAAHGIESVIRVYTNPGGIPKDDALSDIEANAALFNQQDVAVYRASIQREDVFPVLSAAALQGLSATEREDYSAFVVPILDGAVSQPETLLKDLINDVVFNGQSDEDGVVRAGYESMIRENKSIAQILGIRASAGDLEQAMRSLGWIV